MAKKPQPKQSKEEKERRALYDAIEGRLLEMRECLKIHYMDREIDRVEEAITHGINVGLHDIEHIFWDILVETKPAKEILKYNPERLGTRILPVR